MLRSNGVKVITVYIGNDTSFGYVEQRQVVTDIGELASFRVDRADLLINENKTDLLQLAANIPAPISCQFSFTYLLGRSVAPMKNLKRMPKT